MNTFFKTFFVCLVITFSFLAYKFFSITGYSPELSVSKDNPVFGNHEYTTPKETEPLKITKEENKQQIRQEKKHTKHKHICYFYSVNGNLQAVTRELIAKPSLENSITLLLKGPTIAETKKGIYSEIPANVDLLSLKRLNEAIIVDLSSNFGNGGGTKSVENRIKQLSKTIKAMEPNKDVYLHINGKEVEYLGGDGVYIKQPLE